MVLDNVDSEGELSLDQGLGQGGRLGGGEIVEIVLEFALGGLSGGRGRVGAVDIAAVGSYRDRVGAPVGAVEDAGGSHVEEDHVIPGTKVVLDGPSDGVGALVAQVDRDRDLAVGARDGGHDGVMGWGEMTVRSSEWVGKLREERSESGIRMEERGGASIVLS